MERQRHFMFGFVAGMIVLCCAATVLRPEPQSATAQAANSNNRMIAATGQIEEGVDALFLVDTDPSNPRLLVYEARQGRCLRLIGARDIQWDLKLIDFVYPSGKGEPSVGTVRREWEKSQSEKCSKCGKLKKDCTCSN
ncbi:MAG: hypothetical protein RDV41_02200 [Planctomycetota bacterium]|nr:hypothetical protein [Planctomycetota bacterium]